MNYSRTCCILCFLLQQYNQTNRQTNKQTNSHSTHFNYRVSRNEERNADVFFWHDLERHHAEIAAFHLDKYASFRQSTFTFHINGAYNDLVYFLQNIGFPSSFSYCRQICQYNEGYPAPRHQIISGLNLHITWQVCKRQWAVFSSTTPPPM